MTPSRNKIVKVVTETGALYSVLKNLVLWAKSEFFGSAGAVLKITNSKHQITNKSQIQIFNDQTLQPEIGKKHAFKGNHG